MIRPTARAVLIFVCGIPLSLLVVIYDSSLWMISLDYAALVLVTIGMDALLALSPRLFDLRITTPERLYIGERGSISVTLSAPRYRRSIRFELIAEVRGKIESGLPALRVDFGQLMQDVIGDLANNPSPVEIKIFGADQAKLESVAKDVKARIESVRGVVDAFDGIVISGPSFVVHIDGRKAALAGFTPGEVRDFLETAQQGKAESWVRKGEGLVPVRVRYPDAYRNSMEKLRSLPVSIVHGGHFPSFGAVRFRQLVDEYVEGKRKQGCHLAPS